MTNFVTDLWTRLKSAIEGDATTVEATISELEQKLLPGFSALIKKIESTIGSQGVALIEGALPGIIAAITDGSSIGAVIASIIPPITAQVNDDLKQDAATAAHGALELLVAGLPVPVIPAEIAAPADAAAAKEAAPVDNAAVDPVPEPAPAPAA